MTNLPPSGHIQGVLSPVVTPFDRELRPDGTRLIQHCRWLLEQGVGLAVFGTTSEANSLSVAEKIALLDTLVTAGVPPIRMMPGNGGCAFADSRRSAVADLSVSHPAGGTGADQSIAD